MCFLIGRDSFKVTHDTTFQKENLVSLDYATEGSGVFFLNTPAMTALRSWFDSLFARRLRIYRKLDDSDPG